MAFPSTNLTFYLPVMVLVVIEIARIAREVEIQKVVSEDHRPLLISVILLSPLNIIQIIVSFFLSVVQIQVDMAYDWLDTSSTSVQSFIDFQIDVIEFIAGKSPPSEIEMILNDTNESVIKYFNKRIDFAYNAIDSRIDRIESNSLEKLESLETFFAPPLGRFALLHTIAFFILGYLYILSVEQLSGQVRWITVTIVVVLWTMLPVFEVEEYDDILKFDEPVNSFSNHLFLTLLVVYVLWYSVNIGIQTTLITINIFGGMGIPGWVVGVALGAFSVWTYLRSLHYEISRATVMDSSGQAS